MALHKILAFVMLLASATTAQAETFAVNLGNRTLGSLTFQRDGDALQLFSSLNNTPFGVFDGVLDAKSLPVQTDAGDIRRQFLGLSNTSRKSRRVSVLMDNGVVTDVAIIPASENTALSVAELVPAGVVDPVGAFGQFLSANGCPAPIQMYDGRRVVRLTNTATVQTETGLRCDMSYRVIAGPGHLSPFKFKSASVSLIYDDQGLSTLIASTGPFSVRVIRTD